MKKYTTKEVSEILDVNVRTIQRQVATLVADLTNTDGKGALINEDVLYLLKWREANDKATTDQRQDDDTENEEFPFVEYFTAEEYEEFKKRITEYPFLKEKIEDSKEYLDNLKSQIDYFRMSYHRQLDIHEKLIESFRERNFIEAKEKGFEKNTELKKFGINTILAIK